MNRRYLYAQGEPLGDSATRLEPGRRVYGGGGGGKSTTTQSIPNELKPLAATYAGQAIQAGQTPYTPFTGQRFADLNADQTSAIDLTRDRALNGSPVMDAANAALTSTLQGGQTNPYLDALVGKAQKSVVDSYNLTQRPGQIAAGVGSGSFGNSGLAEAQAHQDSQLQQNLGDIATSMYGSAYDSDRARQLSALQLAPTYGNQAYTDAAQLAGAGATQQQQQQQGLDFGYQQFQDALNQPYKNLQVLGAPFTGVSLGGVSTTKTSGK